MTNTIRTIKLHAQEIKKDKQTFISCSAEINGKWYKIKFTKDCDNAPKRKGLYELTVNFDNLSREKGKTYTTKDNKKAVSNDIIWVKNIVSIEKYSEEQLAEENRLEMSEIFGD